MPNSFRSSLLACVMLVTAVGPVVSPPTAIAQTVVAAQQYPIAYVVLQGSWIDPVKGHRYIFKPAAPGRLRFTIEKVTTGEELARGELAPFGRGSTMQGAFTTGPSGRLVDARNSGEVNFSLDINGGFYLAVNSGDLLGETRATTGSSSRPHIKPETVLPADATQAWAGRWRTNRGIIDFVARGGALVAHQAPEVQDRLSQTRGIGLDEGLEVALTPSASDAHGGWMHLASGVRFGDVALRLSPDGKSFSGWYTDVTSGDQRLAWTGERATAENTQAALPSALVSNYEGEWLMRFGAARISRVGAGAALNFTVPERGEIRANLVVSPDGKSLDALIDGWPQNGQNRVRLQLMPEGARIAARLVSSEGRQVMVVWDGLSEERAAQVAGTAGLPLASVPLALYERFSGKWDSNGFDTVIGKDDKGVFVSIDTKKGDPMYRMRAEPSADGAALDIWNTGILGRNRMRIRLVLVSGQRFEAREVRADGSLSQMTWDGVNKTKSVAGVEGGASQPGGAATPPSPPVTPAQPQPQPQGPAPQPTTPSAPQLPADGFRPLGRWDVRLDKVEDPREDRLTHVYLTLRNASSANLYQTGDVWVTLEGADGAPQRSGQGLRAVPGRPELFGSPPPTIRPGGEIRTKFVFDRNRMAGPQRITIEEGEHHVAYSN